MDTAWKIKVKPRSGEWVELKLPALVGSSATADIVVHSPAVPDRAKLLTADSGRLWCWDIQREEYLEEHGLDAYGVEVKGPFPAGTKPGLHAIQSIVQQEERLFAKLPAKWHGALGAHMERKKRWSWFGVLGLGVLLLFGAAVKPSQAQLVDKSRQPVLLGYGHVIKNKMGRAGNFQELRHGATLRFNIPEDARGKDHALEFMLGGADIPEEVELVVNGQKLYSSRVKSDCTDVLCKESVLIPSIFTTSKNIDLIFVHRYPNSDYLITKLLFDELRALTDRERVAAQRRMNLAQRLYDERAVSYQNLIQSLKQVVHVLDIVRLRSDVGQLRAEAESLHEELEVEIAAQTDDMWFQSRRAIRLGEYGSAMHKLKGLLEFYPDPGHPRHVQIKKVLKNLEELQ